MEELDLRARVGERPEQHLLRRRLEVLDRVRERDERIARLKRVGRGHLELERNLRAQILRDRRYGEAADADDVDEVVDLIDALGGDLRRAAVGAVPGHLHVGELDGAPEPEQRRDFAELIAFGRIGEIEIDHVAAPRARSHEAAGRLHDRAQLVVAQVEVAGEALRRRALDALLVEVAGVETAGERLLRRMVPTRDSEGDTQEPRTRHLDVILTYPPQIRAPIGVRHCRHGTPPDGVHDGEPCTPSLQVCTESCFVPGGPEVYHFTNSR